MYMFSYSTNAYQSHSLFETVSLNV